MSIYGTCFTFWIEDVNNHPVEIDVQVVPAWITYDGPEWDFLPPNREWVAEWGDREENGYEHPRAAVFCRESTEKGTARNGQEYIEPLLTLSGEEYERMSFREVMRLLEEKVGRR